LRPPILWITVAFGAGLFLGEGRTGKGEGYVAALVLVVALALARRAPLGAAIGIMGVAGLLWGGATLRERAATCEGRWQAAEEGARAAIVRLSDPAPDSGGPVAADVVAGACGGALRLRWPDGIPAAGGTTWVVAGRWVGSYDRGVLVVRRAKLLDGEPRGRGALRGRLAARSAALFGRRAPLVDALVFAPNAALDPDVRERYARSGLAHILSISGLHVGFLAAWLALILRNLGLSARHRLLASGVVLLGYLWLLGFPAPAARATVMLVVDDVARLRQRVAAPRGVIAVSALAVLLVDPQALHSVGAWLSVTAIAAVVWAGRATRRSHWGVRAVAPAAAATLLTAPITAFAFGTVAPIGVLANLIAIPLGAIVVPGLVISLALSWLVSGLAALLAAGSGLGLGGGGRLAGRRGGGLVVVECSAPSLAYRRTRRLSRDAGRRDVVPRRRPRRLPLLDCIFLGCRPGRRGGAANAERPLGRDRWRPEDPWDRRGATGRDPVPASPRCPAGHAGRGDAWRC